MNFLPNDATSNASAESGSVRGAGKVWNLSKEPHNWSIGECLPTSHPSKLILLASISIITIYTGIESLKNRKWWETWGFYCCIFCLKQLQMKHFFMHVFLCFPLQFSHCLGPFFGASDCHENSRAACTLAGMQNRCLQKGSGCWGTTIHLTFKSGNKLKPPSRYKTCFIETDEFKYLLK